MSWQWTDALTTLHATDDGKALEGIIVPYGVATADERRHMFAVGAFSESVDRWMSRTDGAKLAFRSEHSAPPVGAAAELRDTPAGVWARVELMDIAEAGSYSKQVMAGLNGVSVEAGNFTGVKRMRDGTTVIQKAALHAIAGSVTPAYDGARVSLHDLEDEPVSDPIPEPAPVPAPEPEPAPSPVVANQARAAFEAEALRTYAPARMTRPEFYYGPGREHGILSDGWAAQHGDAEAYERQERHYAMLTDVATETYAGDVLSSEIVGAYPNEYLGGLFTPRILKGRPMGSFFNRIGIDNALPKIFPKAGTATTVAVQGAEKTNPAASDFTTTAVTATPLLYGAETVVTRQVIDGSNPGFEVMVVGDMLEAYAQASETVIMTAVEAGGTASGQAIAAATPFAGLVANLVAYSAARFLPAEGQFIPSALWAVAAKQPDTGSLRPLLSPINPQNAAGVLTGGTLGATLLGADVFHSYASTANVVTTARRDDYVIYESNIARFSYDAVTGPAGVRVGLWAYLVAAARKGGLTVTAA